MAKIIRVTVPGVENGGGAIDHASREAALADIENLIRQHSVQNFDSIVVQFFD